MATLGNILARRGGTAMTPLIVKLSLAVPDPQGGAPLVEQIEVALLPVSEARKAQAVSAAQDYVAEQRAVGKTPVIGDELVFRFFIEAMRDPDDLRKFFVEAKQVETWRSIVIGEQLECLVREYRKLIESEYPETILADADGIKGEAQALFLNGQG